MDVRGCTFLLTSTSVTRSCFRGALYHSTCHADAFFRRKRHDTRSCALFPPLHRPGHEGWQDQSAPL